jgi:outer membrane biosynthesis protein TonB
MINKEDQPFWVYVAISIALHLATFLLFSFGLPFFHKRELEEQIITFEIVPVDSISNIKTQKIQKEEEVIEDKAKKVVKSKSEEAKPEVVKEEKKPEEKKEIVPIKEKKEEKKKEEKPKEDKPKPKKTEPDKKAPPKKKAATKNDMDALLKSLEKESEGKEDQARKRAVTEKSDAIEDAIGKFNEDKPLSLSERDSIKQQIQDKWNVPIGVQSASDILVTVYISLKTDGSVQQVKLLEVSCPIGFDVVCKAAGDSAVRAIWQASPLHNLSPARYDIWKEFNISFDPKDALGM